MLHTEKRGDHMPGSTPASHEKKLKPDDFIVSKTDTKGNITYGNRIFIEMAGYSENELLGAPHNIIRHPDMPRLVFKLLWERIQAKKEIFAYVKNLSKDGSFYWVYANVTASFDNSGNIIGYYSVRRKPNESAIAVVSDLYKKMLEAEKSGGIEASQKVLEGVLKAHRTDYDHLMVTLQDGGIG